MSLYADELVIGGNFKEWKMAKFDIYTYFDAEATLDLCKHAKDGTRSMLNYIRDNHAADFNDIMYAIADCMPQLVADDKIISRGPNKGDRRVAFRDMEKVQDIVSLELTGVGFLEFIRVHDYCKKSMVEFVLTTPNSAPYSKHYIRSFLTTPDFANVKQHYRKMTIKNVAKAKKAVDAYMEANQCDINEVMTWTGDKYNEWHFANMKEAV
jgi:hypothetical protein